MPVLNQRLTGDEVRQLRDALLGAFSPGELRQVAFFALSVRIGDVIDLAQPFAGQTFDLILWADRQGRLRALFEYARAEVPGNRELQRAVGEVVNSIARGDDVEAIVSSNPTTFVNVEQFRDDMAARERAVCRVENPERDPVGTGFLVGPDLVMTCRHVWDECLVKGQREGIRFAFGYRTLVDGTEAAATRIPLGSDGEPIAASPAAERDFVLVRLASPVGEAPVGGYERAPRRGWLKPVGHAFHGSETALILQHPNGQPMKVAFGGVGKLEEDRIPYGIDTLPGSSGAPVFLNDLRLVAMHRQALGEKQNGGVPFSAILPSIQGFLQ
jgi:hypothetical protein